VTDRDDYPPDFGQQVIFDSRNDGLAAWVTPILGGLAFAAYMLMLIMGKAPWQ
jgi:hypothetical protein